MAPASMNFGPQNCGAVPGRLSRTIDRLLKNQRSRSASVIDRLLKNQNPLENRNNLRSSSLHLGPGQNVREPRRNFAVRNSSTRKPRLFRSSVFGSGIRRPDGETVGGCRLARTPPKTRHALAGDFDNRTTGSSTLFSRGSTPVPHQGTSSGAPDPTRAGVRRPLAENTSAHR